MSFELEYLESLLTQSVAVSRLLGFAQVELSFDTFTSLSLVRLCHTFELSSCQSTTMTHCVLFSTIAMAATFDPFFVARFADVHSACLYCIFVLFFHPACLENCLNGTLLNNLHRTACMDSLHLLILSAASVDYH